MRVRAANELRVCASKGCRGPMQYHCERCRLQFCSEHLHSVEITERRYNPPRPVAVVLCGHCAARRKLWD